MVKGRIADALSVGKVVVTDGHVTIDWAARYDAPKQLTAGVRLILKHVNNRAIGFFYRDDMGVLAFPVNATSVWDN